MTSAETMQQRIDDARRYCRLMQNSNSVVRQEMAGDIIAILQGDISGDDEVRQAAQTDAIVSTWWVRRPGTPPGLSMRMRHLRPLGY